MCVANVEAVKVGSVCKPVTIGRRTITVALCVKPIGHHVHLEERKGVGEDWVGASLVLSHPGG